jgi:predicted nucleic acid-binding protein
MRELIMDIVIDTSALLAVIVGEPERDRIVELTSGHSLAGPGAISWEVGNAFSAMMKQRRLTLAEAREGLRIFQTIPLRFVRVDITSALSLAHDAGLYAYDAYFLDCAVRLAAPLLTLDRGLQKAARQVGLKLLEV